MSSITAVFITWIIAHRLFNRLQASLFHSLGSASMRKIATSLIDILVICCLCMALIGPYVFTRRSVRGTDDELLFERVSSRKASIYGTILIVLSCSTNNPL